MRPTQTRVRKPSEGEQVERGMYLEKSTGLAIYKGPRCILHMVIREYSVHM